MKSLVSKAAAVLSFAALPLIATPVMAEVVVIVNPAIADSAGKEDIAKLYLGKTTSLPGGTKVSPVNLESGNAVRDEFNDSALGKSDSQLKSYWSRLIFTGKAKPPKDLGSEAEVIEYVKNNSDGLGYVSPASVTGDVKELARF